MSLCRYFYVVFANYIMGKNVRYNYKDIKSEPIGPGCMLECSVSSLVRLTYFLSILFMLLVAPPYL